MKPERWKQVDELLEAALERPAPERALKYVKEKQLPAFVDVVSEPR